MTSASKAFKKTNVSIIFHHFKNNIKLTLSSLTQLGTMHTILVVFIRF